MTCEQEISEVSGDNTPMAYFQFKHASRGLCLLAGLHLGLIGCQGAAKQSSASTRQIRPPQFEESAPMELDMGDDWDAVEGLIGGSSLKPRRSSDSSDDNSNQRLAALPQPPRYAICLATFTSGDHRLEGQQYLKRVSMLVPDMATDLSLHTDQAGSLVLYGEFDGWKDERVADVTKRIREVQIQGRPLFLNPILTEVLPRRDPATIGPNELLAVRLRHPEVRTIYTLEVAVWGDFESGKLTDARRRRLAEDYAGSLRDLGHQAWYHHDHVKKMSTVTVGVFDHRAIDAASGIRSPAVERVMGQFPARLVNGEVLNIPVSRNDPGAGTKPQKPFLVEVPRL